MSAPLHKRIRGRWFAYLAVLFCICLGVWHFGFGAKPEKNRYPMPAWAGNKWPQLVPVRTVTVQVQDLPVRLKAIGTVTALNTVTVRSRVDGQLLRLAFEEGQKVEKGQLLAEIDPASYRIRLAQMQGQLKQATAQVASARSDLERILNLHRQNLVTAQELDIQQALVTQREGSQAAAQALVDDAQLQLAYTRIEAPLSGRVGIRRIDAGNLVKQTDTNGLVSITQTSPITVSFTIAEVDLQKVLGPFKAGQALSVEAWDRSDRLLLAKGSLRTVDNQIDATTGTLRLKAEFANEKEELFPNQFVNIRIQVETLDRALVIPGAAVQFGSRGTYVYVIDKDNKARVRDVVLGPSDGPLQSVSQGLKDGETIVLEGLDRLRDGFGVVIANGTASNTAP